MLQILKLPRREPKKMVGWNDELVIDRSLRLTLNSDNTMEEMDYVVESIKKIVEKLRSMSPLYEDFVKRQNR